MRDFFYWVVMSIIVIGFVSGLVLSSPGIRRVQDDNCQVYFTLGDRRMITEIHETLCVQKPKADYTLKIVPSASCTITPNPKWPSSSSNNTIPVELSETNAKGMQLFRDLSK